MQCCSIEHRRRLRSQNKDPAPLITINGSPCDDSTSGSTIVVTANKATCADGAAVSFTVAASDDCSTNPNPTGATHNSGDVFPLGDTVVSYAYEDDVGMIGFC